MMTADQISSPTLVASEPISKKTVWASWAIFAQELCHLLLLSPSHGNLWFPSSFSWIQGGMQIVIDGWFKALKCKLFCRADAFISVAKGSDIWQSAISALSIHTFRKHKASKQMHKWSAEERPWGLWDIRKMHLNIYWFPAFPSLCCLLTCHSFPQKDVSYLSPCNSLEYGSPCLCSPELGHSHGMMRSTSAIPVSCNAHLVPTPLISLLVPLNPNLPLAPCSEGKHHHLHPRQTPQKALVTWECGTGE